VVRVPEGIREVIGARLDRLSEECNRVLRIASLVGREFDFTLLDLVIDELSDERLLAVLEEALGARVIVTCPR